MYLSYTRMIYEIYQYQLNLIIALKLNKLHESEDHNYLLLNIERDG